MRSPSLNSLLVVVGRAPESQVGLRKAVVLARHFAADLELLLCESEAATEAAAAGASRILEALRGSIAADDIRVETHWAGGASLREGIARRVAERGHGLVVRSIAAPAESGPSPLTPQDRELLYCCDAPLLLTRHASWAPRPRFVIAHHRHWSPCNAASRGHVLAFARLLARGCHGEVAELDDTPLAPQAMDGNSTGVPTIDALLVPRPRRGEGAAGSTAERVLDEHAFDVVVFPNAAGAGAVRRPLRPRRVARGGSS